MKNRFYLFLLVSLFSPGLTLSAQDEPIAFIGATIYPIEQAPIENGVLIVEDNIITAVGDSRTRIPRGAIINDVSGKVILPGLVDTHSHIGGGDGETGLPPCIQMLGLWTHLTRSRPPLKKL